MPLGTFCGRGGSVDAGDAGDGVTSVPYLNEHQFPAWSTVLLLAMMELEMLHKLYDAAMFSAIAPWHGCI
jgi:hypothetical protein